MNINVISCLNKLFSIKGIINNIGFYFFIILIVICIILFIFFGIKIIQILYKV
jgi:purine-cytosine permease-like protein